jgi:glycosyltransferase involved in cell wall biosynthesis
MSSAKKIRVALVVPAYNEGKVIADVVRGLRNTFRKTSYEYQIVVVDDASKDDTAEQARNGGAHVIQHILNTGSGGATATGLSYAHQQGFDIATTSDADGQHAPGDVLKGVRFIIQHNADLLIGSRLIDKTGMSRVKILGNTGLSIITNVLFGIRITDSQSGLRVFSKQALAELKWKTSGYEFCSEMLWRASQLNLSIQEFPIQAIYTDYSTSKPYHQNNWNAFNIVKSLLKRRLLEFFNE